eukprot:scaffold325192_cov108-Tisochrysis_lutea.AAC.1
MSGMLESEARDAVMVKAVSPKAGGRQLRHQHTPKDSSPVLQATEHTGVGRDRSVLDKGVMEASSEED